MHARPPRPDALDAIAAALRARSSSGGTDAEIAEISLALLDGAPPAELGVRAGAIAARSAREQQTRATIEAFCLEALAALEAGDVAAGTAAARRASRLAREHERGPTRWLADLCLARARRYEGRPHLAARIAGALVPVAHGAWAAWLSWETSLAGGPGAQPDPIAAMVDAAATGDAAHFASATDDTLAWVEGCAPLRREVEDLGAALDASRPASAPLAAWRRGEGAWPRGGLHGVCVDRAAPGVPADVFAVVLAAPDAAGVRVLRAGLPLSPAPGPVLSALGDATHARTLTMLGVLALAGPEGLDRDDLFQRVYGFAFSGRLHAAAFDVLLHRARRLVTPHGAVVRDAGRVTLRLHAPVVVPDPRCAVDADDRVLTLLASAGPLTTESAARELGVPVRTVRTALRRLVEEGTCLETRDGRHVLYHVEDTTFTQPTPPAA